MKIKLRKIKKYIIKLAFDVNFISEDEFRILFDELTLDKDKLKRLKWIELLNELYKILK